MDIQPTRRLAFQTSFIEKGSIGDSLLSLLGFTPIINYWMEDNSHTIYDIELLTWLLSFSKQ